MSDSATIVAGLAIAVIAYLLGHLFGCRRVRDEERIRRIVDDAATVIGFNRELLANAWVQQGLNRAKGSSTESTRLKADRAEAHRMIRELLNTTDVARMLSAGSSTPRGGDPRDQGPAAAQALMASIAAGWERAFGTHPQDQLEPGPRFAATQARRVQQLEAEVGRLLDPPGPGDRLRETIHGAVATVSGGIRMRLSGTRLDPLLEPESTEEIPVA